VTTPTTGSITTHGRIVPLIELGAGFHGELTGRENIYLNGIILGMSRKEIDKKIDVIISFAELSYFIDQPVKHYSSGMYLRLAFSVAVHLEPEIVLIDEILSVGDENFQRKSLNKIQQIIAQDVTVVIVSHSLDLLNSLCTKLLWIEKGKLRKVGKANEVIAAYRQEALGQHTHLPIDIKQSNSKRSKDFKEWGNRKCSITDVIVNDVKNKRQVLSTRDTLNITVKYENTDAVSPFNVLVSIYRLDGVFVAGMTTLHDEFTITSKSKGSVMLRMNSLPLLDGQYFLRVTLYGLYEADPYHVWHAAAEFDVQNTKRQGRGLFSPIHEWDHS
jgi:ABC-type multidrug transport system ATPase subunit